MRPPRQGLQPLFGAGVFSITRITCTVHAFDAAGRPLSPAIEFPPMSPATVR